MQVLSCLVSEGAQSVRSSQKLAERVKMGGGAQSVYPCPSPREECTEWGGLAWRGW